MKKKDFLRVIIFVLIFAIMLQTLTTLLKRKWVPELAVDVGITEGYYGEDDYSLDVAYIGSSHLFSTISPLEIWKKYGITGYVRGSSSQRIWTSYYMLEDTLKNQKPKVVVIEMLKVFVEMPQTEAFNREAYDGLKLSNTKMDAIGLAVQDNSVETLNSYLFPIIRYHDRWKELSESDFTYLTKEEREPTKGFLPRQTVVPVDYDYPTERMTYNGESTQIPKKCKAYLDKIVKLCKDRNISLVFMKSPTIAEGEWDSKKSAGIKEYADENNIPFLDYNTDEDLRNQANIDWSVDTIDAGHHLNYSGAMKISNLFGKYLIDNYKFEDRIDDTKLNNQWNDDYEYCIQSINTYKTINASNLDEFKNYVLSGSYTYMIAYNGKKNLSESAQSTLKELGITINKADTINSMFLVSDNKEVDSVTSKNGLIYNKAFNKVDWSIDIPATNEAQISMCINHEKYSGDNKGLHILLLNNKAADEPGYLYFQIDNNGNLIDSEDKQ